MSESDPIGRLAACWNGKGPHAFTAPKDHQALLRLAYLSEELAQLRWQELAPDERQKLLFAARSCADLGATCRWALA